MTTGTPWEAEIGYARAVRIGDIIAVSGTVAAGPDGHATSDHAYGQARDVLRIVDGALRRLGSRLENVLRLRVHYADPGVGPGFARALKEAFPDGAPALTGVRVTGLVEPEFLLELEADAAAGEWQSEAPPLPEWDEGVD